LNVPIFWILHESSPKEFIDHLKIDISTFYIPTKIIYVCSNQKSFYGFLDIKETIVYNSLNINKMNRKKHQFVFDRRKYGIENSDILLCMVGTIDSNKRQIEFIREIYPKLLNKFGNIKLLIIGKNTMEKDILDLYLNKYKNIIYTGQQQNVLPYIMESDIVVSYSKREVFPLSILEAMFCKKPIVATNTGGISEQIIDNYNGFLCKIDDTEEFVKNISILIENENLRKEFGKNGKKLIIKKFNEDVEYKKYHDLINLF
jgi:glycosyltransferase involved in cell wall biosynthesis